MDITVLNYAKTLDAIGDKIIAASNLIQTFDVTANVTVEELKSYHASILTAIEKYRSIKSELEMVTPPVNITKEHGQLIKVFGDYIEGNHLLANSINIDKSEINKTEFISGMSSLKVLEQRIKQSVEIISNKLL